MSWLCTQNTLTMQVSGLATSLGFSLLADLTVVLGLSVMPAAIDRDVIQACTATPSKDGKSRVHISNVNEKFKPEEFEFQPGKEGPAIDPKHHR